jgi:endonuclease YncB( thermonuclease family)
MRPSKQRRRVRRTNPTEQALLSAPQMIGLTLFVALLCLALWMAYRPTSHAPLSDQVQYRHRDETYAVEAETRAEVGQLVPRKTSATSHQGSAATFQRCDAVRENCVVDGDTFWFHGVKIRIADIDAPEISKPSCAHEYQLGLQATFQLVTFLNAGPFDLSRPAGRKQDRFGRELFLLSRGEQSFGDSLVALGLGHRWYGRKESWCG